MIQFDAFSYQAHMFLLIILSGVAYNIFLYYELPYLYFFFCVRASLLCGLARVIYFKVSFFFFEACKNSSLFVELNININRMMREWVNFLKYTVKTGFVGFGSSLVSYVRLEGYSLDYIFIFLSSMRFKYIEFF